MSAPRPPEQCSSCTHFRMEYVDPPNKDPLLCDAGVPVCDAFPVWPGIPIEITTDEDEGWFDHTQPFPGDHGIRYEDAGG